jgi:hypothetical protein
MKSPTRFLRTFVAVGCMASMAACIDGDDVGGPGGGGSIPANLRNLEIWYEGEKLSWRPAEGEQYQGLGGAVSGEVFQIDAVLLDLQKGTPGILKDEGYAGIMWKHGGALRVGEYTCGRGEVVIAVQFPHVGHLVTHADAVHGGHEALANPVSAGVDCSINVTRTDKVGGFIEGTIRAKLAYVPFQDAAPGGNAIALKDVTMKFKLVRFGDL